MKMLNIGIGSETGTYRELQFWWQAHRSAQSGQGISYL